MNSFGGVVAKTRNKLSAPSNLGEVSAIASAEVICSTRRGLFSPAP